jgi:hypothetical protein
MGFAKYSEEKFNLKVVLKSDNLTIPSGSSLNEARDKFPWIIMLK